MLQRGVVIEHGTEGEIMRILELSLGEIEGAHRQRRLQDIDDEHIGRGLWGKVRQINGEVWR